jgi:hypothetical protein
VIISETINKSVIPRHQTIIWASRSIALLWIKSFVFALMMRKIIIISAGPAEKAVAINLKGILEVAHMGTAGIVFSIKAVKIWILGAQTMHI